MEHILIQKIHSRMKIDLLVVIDGWINFGSSDRLKILHI